MSSKTFDAIANNEIQKGDVLGLARIAAVMATKKTSELIPLCHPLRINSVDIEFEALPPNRIKISALVTAIDRTGVEMEALTSAAAAALTIYDMCKSMDRGMVISHLQLEEKAGGKSGHFIRNGNETNTTL